MASGRIKEVLTRLITGFILFFIALWVIIKGHPHVFFLVIEILLLLGTHEMIKIVKGNESIKVYSSLIWSGAVIIPASIYFGNMYSFGFNIFLAVAFLYMFLIFLLKMFSSNPTENALETVSYNLFAVLYLPFLFTFLCLLKDYDYKWLLYLCFVIWASDSFAYFSGLLFGKHKLIPLVSPGKTIEGLAGGVVGALVIASIFKYYLLQDTSWVMALILAVEIIVAGIVGDLIESLTKRSAKIKDSGSLFPGHGGILDRFDSIIIAAPVLYFYLTFLK